MIDAAAFAITADLLAVVADLPAATARHAELAKLTACADVAESSLASKRQDFERHQASARAKLARMESEVAKRRETTERAESGANHIEAGIIEDEAAWKGLGLPQDAPYRPTSKLN
jgi:hypothetical protein